MKLATKIIKKRLQNPFMSTNQLAKEISASVGWVHEVLKNADLQTNPPRKLKSQKSCPQCDTIFVTRRKFCSEKCKYHYQYPLLKCDYCQISFRRSRHEILQSGKKGSKHAYCDLKCWNRARSE